MTIHVSDHALDRYRQRFCHAATKETVAGLVGAATQAPAWVKKCFADQHYEGGEMWAADGIVFVVVPRGDGWVVVTCLLLKWAEGTRKVYGKKWRKLRTHAEGVHRAAE